MNKNLFASGHQLIDYLEKDDVSNDRFFVFTVAVWAKRCICNVITCADLSPAHRIYPISACNYEAVGFVFREGKKTQILIGFSHIGILTHINQNLLL